MDVKKDDWDEEFGLPVEDWDDETDDEFDEEEDDFESDDLDDSPTEEMCQICDSKPAVIYAHGLNYCNDCYEDQYSSYFNGDD